jgi:DNA-binding NtrC family response regulator
VIRVIIIDDEMMLSKMLKGFLEDRGFEVATAATGREGLGHIGREPFDVAVVDVRLPDMDGSDIVVRAATLRPELKFIMHTGSIDYIPPEDLAALGIDAGSIIRKPVLDMDDIRKMIEKKALSGRS